MTWKLNEWEHLGDGLYVAFDGYQLMLRVNDHRNEPTFYVEQRALRALNNYAKQIWGPKS